MECIKNMPCNLKLAYVLIAVLFLSNIFVLVKTCKQSASASSNQEIANWIDKNPEVILESVNKYAMSQQEEMMKQQQSQALESIGKYEKELKDTKYAGVLNPKGTIDIVEFYDYNCGYCKVSAKNVEELLKKRKDIRVILRALPILSESSRYATEIGTAILISEPTKYPSYYKALMEGSARNKEGIKKAVESIGLNMDKIEKVLSKNKSEIDNAINNNLELASKIGINGTPAFIINGELIPGAVDVQTLDSKATK